MEGVPPERGEGLERTRSHLCEERDDLAAELTQLRAEHQRTQDELTSARGEVQRQSEELEAVQHELELAMVANEELDYRCKELTEQNHVLHRKLRDASDDVDAVQDSEFTSEADLPSTAIAAGRDDDVDTGDSELRERLVDLRSENSALKAELAELREKNQGEQEARLKAEQLARDKCALAAAAERREREAQEEQAKLATEYEELPGRLQEMQRLYQQAELERTRMLEDMKRAEAAEQSKMGRALDDGLSLLDELEEPPQQPDDEAIEQVKRSIELKQVAQLELEANRRELRELRAEMDEMQQKWNSHLLQAQREEAKAEQERAQKQEEEAVRTTLPLSR